MIYQIPLYALEFILAFFSIYALWVLLGMTIPVNRFAISNGEQITCYVLSNGMHTDICIPVKMENHDVFTFIDTNDFHAPIRQRKYIAFGWGDQGFYLDTPTWDELKMSTALKAMFLPSKTAMHVALMEKPIENERCKKVLVAKRGGYDSLLHYIKASFASNESQPSLLIPNRGYWNNDNFYHANGSYHLWETCNSWTNKGLQIAGVKTAWDAFYIDGIFRHLDD